MTDEVAPENLPDDGEDTGRENKGSPDEPWQPGEQKYADRPEQGSRPDFRNDPSGTD